MRVFNLRLSDEQFEIAKSVAKKQSKPISHILRDAIDVGLEANGAFLNQNDSKNRVETAPKYATITTSCTIETLILLRKFIEKSSPDLIDIAKELALKKLDEEDMAELIRF